jgi:hypothetical protein
MKKAWADYSDDEETPVTRPEIITGIEKYIPLHRRQQRPAATSAKGPTHEKKITDK